MFNFIINNNKNNLFLINNKNETKIFNESFAQKKFQNRKIKKVKISSFCVKK